MNKSSHVVSGPRTFCFVRDIPEFLETIYRLSFSLYDRPIHVLPQGRIPLDQERDIDLIFGLRNPTRCECDGCTSEDVVPALCADVLCAASLEGLRRSH
ncbi:unnamed protein product [Strongylus vulgaris]|uniref:Uncharacterized protein n=1 Tax=Strongylus vulgaris TaxID=40348 RepID=A0A3P7K6Y9_STRVU|nr:unnamed protein product [Strongylus vulgaris]